ncbi:MAG: hypothetical protein JJE21_02735 [Spirochaetaceae bacterium]|nr:hypothetical protein [Spirochaetaceae bacterium]
MAQTLIFHYREASNFLSKTHPMIKLLSLILICIPLVNASLNGILLIFGSLIISSIIIKMPLISYLKELTFLIIISIIIGISNYISSKNLIQTSIAVLKFITAVYASLLLADSTDPGDLSRALGKTLNHIPFINGWAIASQIELTLSILPLIFDTTSAIREARLARGERALKHPLKAMVGLIYNLMDNLLTNIDEMAYALDGRVFNSAMVRSGIKYKKRDFLFIIFVISLSIGGFIL